jgi:hypothetical protein
MLVSVFVGAEFDASRMLVRAREAVRCDASPATLKALEQAAMGWNRAMDKIAERAARTTVPATQRRFA